jgi:hypothetical protein
MGKVATASSTHRMGLVVYQEDLRSDTKYHFSNLLGSYLVLSNKSDQLLAIA